MLGKLTFFMASRISILIRGITELLHSNSEFKFACVRHNCNIPKLTCFLPPYKKADPMDGWKYSYSSAG